MRLRTLVQIALGVMGAATAIALRASGSGHRTGATLLLFGSVLFLAVMMVDAIRERRRRPSEPAGSPPETPLSHSRSGTPGRRPASLRQP